MVTLVIYKGSHGHTCNTCASSVLETKKLWPMKSEKKASSVHSPVAVLGACRHTVKCMPCRLWVC